MRAVRNTKKNGSVRIMGTGLRLLDAWCVSQCWLMFGVKMLGCDWLRVPSACSVRAMGIPI